MLKIFKKNFSSICVLLLTASIFLAYRKNDSKQIQDTNAAMIYFQNELNFTAGPGSVKKVVNGKLDGVIIDLRKKEHFDEGHIPNAINLPFDKFTK